MDWEKAFLLAKNYLPKDANFFGIGDGGFAVSLENLCGSLKISETDKNFAYIDKDSINQIYNLYNSACIACGTFGLDLISSDTGVIYDIDENVKNMSIGRLAVSDIEATLNELAAAYEYIKDQLNYLKNPQDVTVN